MERKEEGALGNEEFVEKHKNIVNALILLSNVFSPSESTYEGFTLLRDHLLLPIYGKKNEEDKYPNEEISKIHFHVNCKLINLLVQTGDILRSLGVLPKYTLPQYLLDSKCGYTPFTSSCKKAAERILTSFFDSVNAKKIDENAWDLVDEYANKRESFEPVAIAIDSISVFYK